MFFGFEAECAAQSDAGYAALKEAGLPSSVKIFEKMTIGEASENPGGANGKGLEYFGAGSTVADDALVTFVEAADAPSCA